MPSGTYITAEYGCFRPDDCFLNIHVYLLAEDFSNSEGLCGNYNGVYDDDRTTRDTNVMDNVDEPVDFVKSYV